MASIGIKVSREYLRECFSYNQVTGDLVWKERPAHHFKEARMIGSFNNKYAGKLIRSKDSSGYYIVNVCRTTFKAHRIIYTLCKGEIPNGYQVDHINGIRDDNRMDNLRLVTNAGNARNRRLRSDNKTGVNGVCFDKESGKYLATVKVGDKQKNVGRYLTIEQARMARDEYISNHPELNYSSTHGTRVTYYPRHKFRQK